jgi:uncharacterized protein YkwD
VLAVALLAAAVPMTAEAQTPTYRPDALIRKGSERTFTGNGFFTRTDARETRTSTVQPGAIARFYVQVQNDGNVVDDLRIVGTSESSQFYVRYYWGAQQVSPQVKAGSLVLDDVDPGDARTLTVEVQPHSNAPWNAQRIVRVIATSVGGGTSDTVSATVKVADYTTNQLRVASLINQSRGSYGRGGLPMNRQLTDKAQAWAERLARQGYLSHSDLRAGAPSGWRALAENVGTGSSITQVHQAFMNSSGHRSNILGTFNSMGTGYAVGHGRVWVVHEFMLR